MESLPPYQELTNTQESPVTSASEAARTVAAADPNPSTTASPIIDAQSVIGASGARLPLTEEQRVAYDREVVNRLGMSGPYIRTMSLGRSETFRPEDQYQSAASQLNVLLPGLSSGTVPVTTALRVVTLRISMPIADPGWVTSAAFTGPVQGRALLGKAYKHWMSSFAAKRGGQVLYELADAITGRMAMEGFLVLEEWWDLRRGLLMLTIRC